MRHMLRAMAIIVVVLFIFALSNIVSAHEKRTIAGGKYDVKVGWKNEPAVVNQPNGATIEVKKAGTQDVIKGVEKTLQVKISLGGKDLFTLPLTPLADTPSAYVADFTPSATGSFVWTFSGDIEGNPINEEFNSGPGRFDDVITAEDAAKVTPVNDDETPSATQAVTESISALPTSSGPIPVSTTSTANTDTTTIAATVGIVVLLVAGALILSGRKPKA